MKRYRVGEVCKITGLSRQNLADYAKKEIVIPVDHVYQPGYKIYDEEGLKTLKQIAIFKGLDFSEKMIERIIKDEDIDKDGFIKEHIIYLKNERNNLDDKILVAGVIDLCGIEDIEIYSDNPNVKEIAKGIKKSLNDKDKSSSKNFKRLLKNKYQILIRYDEELTY